MLPINTRTVYDNTDTDIQTNRWTLTRSKLTTILDLVNIEGRSGRIKGYWLVETNAAVMLLHPNFELMAGINKHPALKNPELIMLSNLDIVSLSIKEAVLGIYGHPVQFITYGNFFCNPDSNDITTECSYLFLDFTKGQ